LSLPASPGPFRGAIGRSYSTSLADFPRQAHPPSGAPNVLLILLDDVGFGQPSPFGGPVEMPSLAALAERGLRYNHFHTTALCSPTRAALLTGQNHHAVATGAAAEMATGFPGYNMMWPRRTACVAEVLRLNGHATAAFGKWHNTPEWETGPFGPFDRWPTGLGFEYFYGFMGADCDQWQPNLFENTRPVEPDRSPEEGYHLDVDLADRAIAWLRLRESVVPDRPFFLYYAPGTAHAPHHAPREWIDRYAGAFDHGWDRQRELTFQRQQELGVIPSDAALTARPTEIPAWDDLSDTERRIATRLQEAFAGALSHCDDQIGRVLTAIDDLGERDNTLVIYIAGDNGPAAEGTLRGQFNKWAGVNGLEEDREAVSRRLDEIGGPTSYNNYPAGWAWAGATPLQWFKQIASHFGGTRNGAVIAWPERITDHNALRTQFHHCVDVVPTILQAVGIPAPEVVNGTPQRELDGLDMSYTFASSDSTTTRRTQYFEMFGNRGLFHDGWMASARHSRLPWQFTGGSTGEFDSDRWELYRVEDDFSQARDLALLEPERLRELQDLWWVEAARNSVLPLDDRSAERLAVGADRNASTARTVFEYYPGAVRIPEASSPNVKGRAHSIAATVSLAEDDEGVLVAAGGRFAGYVLYIRDGRLHYVHNLCDIEHYRVSSEPLEIGERTLRFTFAPDEPRLGSGGTAFLFDGERPIGRGRIPRTVPFRYSYCETFDVGRDSGSAVIPDYTCPFAFTGSLDRVVVEIHSDLGVDERGREEEGLRAVEDATH